MDLEERLNNCALHSTFEECFELLNHRDHNSKICDCFNKYLLAKNVDIHEYINNVEVAELARNIAYALLIEDIRSDFKFYYSLNILATAETSLSTYKNLLLMRHLHPLVCKSHILRLKEYSSIKFLTEPRNSVILFNDEFINYLRKFRIDFFSNKIILKPKNYPAECHCNFYESIPKLYDRFIGKQSEKNAILAIGYTMKAILNAAACEDSKEGVSVSRALIDVLSTNSDVVKYLDSL